MSAQQPEGSPLYAGAPHQARQVAESFGSDADRYDRARPSYPDSMIERIVANSPGRDVVDVGCGTGICARQFQAVGCRVLGVEVDPRMAELARRSGGRRRGRRIRELESGRPAVRHRRRRAGMALGRSGGGSGQGCGGIASRWPVGRALERLRDAGRARRGLLRRLSNCAARVALQPRDAGSSGIRGILRQGLGRHPRRMRGSAMRSSGRSIGSGPTRGTNGSTRCPPSAATTRFPRTNA